MHRAFSTHELYTVAEANFSESEVNGNGGVHAPVFLLPMRIDFQINPQNPLTGVRFVSLHGRLGLGHEPFAVAPAVNVNVLLRAEFSTLKDQQYYLEFPLDAARIAFIEKIRAGGDLKFRLHLTLAVEKLRALSHSPLPHDTAWGLVHGLDIHLQEELVIPQSAWTSRVLPRIGYGTVHLVELPAISLSAIEVFKEAFESLRQAQEHHKQGLYDEAAAKCRVALERFYYYPEVTGDDGLTRRVPTLKKSWETKLGKATYDWLNASLNAIKQAANPPHHGPGPHYDQVESQMLIAITIAVVAYAAKHGAET